MQVDALRSASWHLLALRISDSYAIDNIIMSRGSRASFISQAARVKHSIRVLVGLFNHLGALNEELEGVLMRIDRSSTKADSNYFAGLLFSCEKVSRYSDRVRKFIPHGIQSEYSIWEDSRLAGRLGPVHEHRNSIVPINMNRMSRAVNLLHAVFQRRLKSTSRTFCIPTNSADKAGSKERFRDISANLKSRGTGAKWNHPYPESRRWPN